MQSDKNAARRKQSASSRKQSFFSSVSLTPEERTEVRSLTKKLMADYDYPGSVASEAIMAAELQDDLDKLRAYHRLMPSEGVNTQRLDLVIGFYRRQGMQEVNPFLTAEKTIAVARIGIAIAEGTGFASGYLEDPSFDPLVLETLNHMDRIDDMVELIKVRHVLDPESIVLVLAQMDDHHGAVTGGIL